MTEKGRRKEDAFRYFAGKIRWKSKDLDDLEVYALGAIDELEADDTICDEDALEDLRRRLIEARDAYEKVLSEVADKCEDRAERWKFYPVETGGERGEGR